MNDYNLAKNYIAKSDTILITASNGLSIAEGYHIFADNADFKKYFGDFRSRYGIPNLISGVFAELPEPEHKRFMRQVHKYLIEDYHGSSVMKNLLEIIAKKNYFILTTNADTHFQLNGFDADSIFEAEGNFYGMEMQSSEWKTQLERFRKFVSENADKNLLVMELGVGPRNQYLKTPVMNLLLQNPKWKYLALNLERDIVIPRGLEERSRALAGDIAENLKKLVGKTI